MLKGEGNWRVRRTAILDDCSSSHARLIKQAWGLYMQVQVVLQTLPLHALPGSSNLQALQFIVYSSDLLVYIVCMTG